MKRQLVAVTALWTVVSALACGSDNAKDTTSDAAAAQEDKTQGQSQKPDADSSKSPGGQAGDGKTCKDDSACEHGHCVQGICCQQACSTPETECRDVANATCEDGQTCKYPLAKDGAACADADACKTGSTCKGGVCQPGTKARACDDNNPCTDDSCDPTLGCLNRNNTQACDDNNACTEGDQCKSGVCQGATERDCSAQNDACNEGVCDPKDGSCKLRPAAEGSSCAADSCNKAASCKAGECKGDNACGPNASACSVGNMGSPNSCTCKEGFHAADGLCVPENDECAAKPCGQNADCFDPSSATGDVTCSCKAGFGGDAKQGCSAQDPCANNPCGEGRGTCSASAGDQHSCSCSAGFREVAGQCVCDMQGTFALRYDLTISWKDLSGIENGSAQTNKWAIVRQNYDANGKLELEQISCGETNIDLCGTGIQIAGIRAEAYSQYVPAAAWGGATMPSGLAEFDLPAPLPGSAFKTPRYAVLSGISLTDPIGAWPSRRQDIEGGDEFDGSATNGARWIDSDQDTLYGVTTYAVGPNGSTSPFLPPVAPYAQISMVCPRGNPSAVRLPYNYPPALDGLTARRVKRFSSANRAVSELDGTLQSCDLISGNVTGPNNGATQLDVRVGACVRVEGDSGEVACSSALLNFLDSAQVPSAIDKQTFTMKRVDAAITCEQVRALSF